MIVYIVIGIVVLLVLYMLSTYNSLVKIKNRVSEAFSTMDVYLKKRWDLIPNLVETVKGYVKHEEGVLEEVTKLRNVSYDSMSNKDKVEADQKLSQGISKLIAISEAYPELKANENFNNLSNELSKIENDIANSRKYYNATVRTLNDKVQMFPGSLVANIFGFKTTEMFEVDETQRENVKVEF